MKKVITSSNAPAPIGPYSHANLVPAGNMLFVSGQVAKDAETGALVLDNNCNFLCSFLIDNKLEPRTVTLEFEHLLFHG